MVDLVPLLLGLVVTMALTLLYAVCRYRDEVDVAETRGYIRGVQERDNWRFKRDDM